MSKVYEILSTNMRASYDLSQLIAVTLVDTDITLYYTNNFNTVVKTDDSATAQDIYNKLCAAWKKLK